MKFACDHPAVVKKLVIVDIAAKSYPPYHDNEFRAMKRVPAGAFTNRREAEEVLKQNIPDWGLRQFIMTNLVRGEFGLQWQCNLEVLHSEIMALSKLVDDLHWLAKNDVGQIKPAAVPVDINQSLQDVLESFEERRAAKAINLENKVNYHPGL